MATVFERIRLYLAFMMISLAIGFPAWAQTSAFFPDESTSITSGLAPEGSVLGIFRNPAFFTPEASQVFVQSKSDVWGYSSRSVGVLAPMSAFSLSLGYQSFSASDIIVAAKPAAGRPSMASYTQDAYRMIQGGLGIPLTDSIAAGVKVRYLHRQLYTDQVTSFTGDLGMRMRLGAHYRVGVYTSNLLQSPLRWSSSATQETLPIRCIVEGYYEDDLFQIGVRTTIVNVHNLMAAYRLAPTVLLYAEGLFSNRFALSQASIGTYLEVGAMFLQYTYILSGLNAEDFSQSQHTIGIGMRL